MINFESCLTNNNNNNNNNTAIIETSTSSIPLLLWLLFSFEKRSLTWLAVTSFVIEPLTSCQHFELMIELKLNWLRFWYHMPATSLQSKCNMICDKFAWIRRGKILVFKSKALSFYTTLLCMFLLYGREWYCCESFTLNSMCQCLGKRGSHNITFSASLHIKQLYSF